MKILMITPDEFPPDIRIEKEARSLIVAGHQIILALPRRKETVEQLNYNDIDVRYVTLPDREFNSKLEYAFYRTGLSSAVNPAWVWRIQELVSKEKIKAIHVHNLPLVDAATQVAQAYDIPLISDLHELYPENIEASYSFPTGYLISWLGRWHERERRCLQNSAKIIVISDSARDYYVKRYHINLSKFVVLGGMIDLDEFYSFPLIPDIVNQFKDKYTICYAGGSGSYRGIEVLVKAFNRIQPYIPNAHLLLIGPHSANIIDSCKPGTATITGWVDYSLFRSYISSSKIAVHPLLALNKQMQYASPNKIFQYMASGVPIIATRTQSFQKFIADTGVGILFKSRDDKDLAGAILQLYKSPIIQRYSARALEVVKNEYNWKNESSKLLEIYK
jgi:glycosyltransferase involved in cell wall biosynthesis